MLSRNCDSRQQSGMQRVGSMRTVGLATLVGFLVAALLPALVTAQGVLLDIRPDHLHRLPRPIHPPHPIPHPIRPPIPRPVPTSYKIQELAVNVNLVDQIAKVQVSQSFVNTGSRAMEVCFVFPLPYDGAVDRLTFMVDGKEYDAKLLDAKEARRIYEGYIRRNQDPALLEWMGTGMFKTSVFPVPAGAKRTVTLRYSQVCRKLDGLTEFLFPLSTAKYTSHPVENLRFAINIQSQVAIKNVYSPTHSVEIKRPNDEHAVVQLHQKNLIPNSDFRLFFDVGGQAVGASVLSYRPDKNEQGYLMMLISPEIKKQADKQMKKNILFVVDRSGSMSGKKIEQAKSALKFVLNNLNKDDLFNVIAYDSEVESFQPELQKYNDKTRKQAIGFVEGIFAGGSTNIDGALTTALAMLQDNKRPSYVVFLTDGLPTAGETGLTRIVANAKKNNKVRARIFNFGVGYDVNSRLLDKLARVCYGQSLYVRPNEDIEDHVSKLFRRIGAPAMTDIAIKVDLEGQNPEDGSTVNRLYPRDAYDLFAGDQLVLVGRYKNAGNAKVTVAGTVDGKKQSFSFPAKLKKKSKDETNAFVQKVWASRRIGEIIDEIDLQGKNQELIDELIKLSTKHGILTPYTSFLADDNVSPQDFASNRGRANRALEALEEDSGEAGFSQRAAKARFQQSAQAPAGGAAVYSSAKSDKSVAVHTIQNVGSKTFFYRNECWIDSTATEDRKKNARKITRYSDEYFELVTRYGKHVAKYLALEGHVIVVLDGQAYEF